MAISEPDCANSLVAAGLLFRSGVDGVFGRSEPFQAVVDAFGRLIGSWGSELQATAIRFPPVVARATFDSTNYLCSFPDLVGSVHSFCGDDRQHAELVRRLADHEEWADLAAPADVVLSASACHPVYPLCTGRVPDGGRFFDVRGFCFRNEPSDDPSRMRAFEMHELVFVGDEARALEHQDFGVVRGLELLGGLELEVGAVAANDPFFGRIGRLLRSQQSAAGLKIEVVDCSSSVERPTALMSANYHRDHFAVPFGIDAADGSVSHSACVGFGLDRIAIALFRTHGVRLAEWPSSVREVLWP
ncbi:MAG: amino acid--[acyl-carrier-protein] ligase [Acidimicrobiales bacterium]